MAFKVIDRLNKQYNGCEQVVAVLDSAADLDALKAACPAAAPGSLAITATKPATVYMVNASNEWKEV